MNRLKDMVVRKLGAGGRREDAGPLHRAIVCQSRAPEFYTGLGVADSIDGRFEMLCLHGFLVLHRLKQEPGGGAERLGQALVDALFLDLDRSLREMGVGDLSVGKRMKKMGQAFYGRAVAYEDTLQEADDSALEAAIMRNVFAGAAPVENEPRRLAAYVRASVRLLAQHDLAALRAGKVDFGPVGQSADGGPGASGVASTAL